MTLILDQKIRDQENYVNDTARCLMKGFLIIISKSFTNFNNTREIANDITFCAIIWVYWVTIS